MSTTPLQLAVIIGSTRPGRLGERVGRWFADEATRHDGVDVDLIDLLQVDLPAALGAHPNVDAYTARLAAADAFVVVTPEYNHGYPASVKQAIDVASTQWNAKPVGFVSYGGMSGGLRAVEQLRQVFAEVHAVTMRDTVSFHNPWSLFDDDGTLREPSAADAAAKVMLDQIVWWGAALRRARDERPYGS